MSALPFQQAFIRESLPAFLAVREVVLEESLPDRVLVPSSDFFVPLENNRVYQIPNSWNENVEEGDVVQLVTFMRDIKTRAILLTQDSSMSYEFSQDRKEEEPTQ